MQQQTHHEPTTSRMDPGEPKHPLIAAARVKGTDVYGSDGERIAQVEDVAIEKVGGEVAYAILSFGGFLGFGENYYPVPWSMLSYDPGRRGYVVPCTREQLENAPNFEPDDLSGWSDSSIRDEIYAFYGPMGARPYWGAGGWAGTP
jgi:sporulation protein YlmC with PRC-barrel domain